MSFTPQQQPTAPLHVGVQGGSLMAGYLAPPAGLPPPPMPPFTGFPGVAAPNQPTAMPQTLQNSGQQPTIIQNRPVFNRKPNEGYEKRKDQYRPHYASDRQTVTVFVGNITEHASDALIRQLLMKCGIVVNWKRVQGADGKLQAFGFCEYSDAEAGLRAIRLLHDLTVGEKNLVVKVDAKTKDMLDAYKKKKAEEQASKNNGETDELHDPNWHKDDEVKKNIKGLLSDNADVLSGKFAGTASKWKASHSGSEENLEGMGMDKDKKRLISSEIRLFRDAYKDYEKERRERAKAQEKEVSEKENRERENEKERDRDRGKDRARERDHSQEKEYDRQRNDDKNSDGGRSRDRDRDRNRDDREQRRSDRRERELDEDEQYEKRKRERRLKERNQAFVDRLKTWEGRERKRQREYDRDLEKERELENEQSREKKHLLEFLEDYDDDQDDPKYYKGGSFDRRLQARLIEMESDEKDRQRELEEIEEIKMTLKDRPVVQEEPMEEDLPPPVQIKPEPEPKPTLQATFKVVESAPKVASPVQQVELPKPGSPKPAMVNTGPAQEENHTDQVDGEAASKKTFVFEMKAKTAVNSSNQNRKKLESVFNSEEDSAAQHAPKRKLVPLDYSEEEMKAVGSSAARSAEEKKKSIKLLIERIPTAKDELFAYSLDWECVDQTLIDRRIRPWVNKKIVEYIGEEEPSLVDFMCSKLLARSQPQNILQDVSMVLDDEAEVFVVKMWRLLIYETEAKKIGLVK